MSTVKKKVVKEKLVKMPDWLNGIKLVGDVLVIPTSVFDVRKVTSQDAVSQSTVSVHFEVTKKPTLITGVASGSISPEEMRRFASMLPNTYASRPFGL